ALYSVKQEILMKQQLLFVALATGFAALPTYADCPDLVGKYAVQCSIARDDEANLGKIIETSGQMSVDQVGCDLYRFTELARLQTEVIDLNEADPSHDEAKVDIKKSNDRKLRVKILAREDSKNPYMGFIRAMLGNYYITKVKVRQTRNGFIMKGKEK